MNTQHRDLAPKTSPLQRALRTLGRPHRTVRLAGSRRVMLMSWAGAAEDRCENIVCVDGEGIVQWRATLPRTSAKRDCFVSLRQVGQRLVAATWSGLVVGLCPQTGAHLAEVQATS